MIFQYRKKLGNSRIIQKTVHSYQDSFPGENILHKTVKMHGHSDVVFWPIFGNGHRNVLPVHHQQTFLINGFCCNFDMKSNDFGPVIPGKPKVFKNYSNKAINWKKVFL